MDADMFAEDVAIADAEPGGIVLILEVLGRIADDATGMKPVAAADLGVTRQMDMRPNNTIRAQFHGFVDDSIRPDLDGGGQFRFRMNDGGRMDHAAEGCRENHRFVSRIPSRSKP